MGETRKKGGQPQLFAKRYFFHRASTVQHEEPVAETHSGTATVRQIVDRQTPHSSHAVIDIVNSTHDDQYFTLVCVECSFDYSYLDVLSISSVGLPCEIIRHNGEQSSSCLMDFGSHTKVQRLRKSSTEFVMSQLPSAVDATNETARSNPI